MKNRSPMGAAATSFVHLLGKIKPAAAKKAEDDREDDEKAEDEDAEEGDEDDEGKEKAARRSERVRCARIIAHGIKIGRVEQAGVLAFDTDLSVKIATSTMDAMGAVSPTKGRQTIGDRMAGVSVPKVGASDSSRPAADSPQALAAQMLGAYERAAGKTS